MIMEQLKQEEQRLKAFISHAYVAVVDASRSASSLDANLVGILAPTARIRERVLR